MTTDQGWGKFNLGSNENDPIWLYESFEMALNENQGQN